MENGGTIENAQAIAAIEPAAELGHAHVCSVW
jgi:hypothetical protein